MNNENIKIEKSFPVNASALYKAWTEEEALKSWWQPAGRKLKLVQADLKDGGALKYIFEDNGNDEGELIIEGEYEAVVPEVRLAYTWNWMLNNETVKNGEYKLNVEFSDNGNEATLTIHQESLNDAEGIHPHQDGWEKSLNDLESYLAEQQGS